MIEVHLQNGLWHLNWRVVNEKQYDWCKENCEEYFYGDILALKTRWSFVSKLDAVAFKLRWY